MKEIADNLFSGLPCATVLIGIFDKDTGAPIGGVVNQPFYKNNDHTYDLYEFIIKFTQ